MGYSFYGEKKNNACFVNYERTSGYIRAQALYYLKLDYLHNSHCTVTDWVFTQKLLVRFTNNYQETASNSRNFK